MQARGDLMTHVRLVSRMAKCTQADLVAAYEAGSLSQEAWAEMVQSCRSCRWAGGCAEWLDEHPQAEKAPSQCLNRRLLDGLQVPERTPGHG